MMKKIFSVLIACAVAATAMAVPARRDGVLYTQSDGSQITVYTHGDENFHYLTNEKGQWLQRDEKGDFQVITALSREEIATRRANGKYAVAQRKRIAKALQETGTDRLLAPRGPVILVSYPDEAFSSSNADMTQWAMGETYTYNGATGSVHQYFYDQSWGAYDMEIEVYGPVTVSKSLSYYGSNDYFGDDQHPDELVVEACKLAQQQGADFSKYDSNGDGYVDWVVILYAGKGEADGGDEETIWPHQYDLHYTNKSFKLNGKTVDHYCCLNEIEGSTNKRCGIGTFCHEFSHVMGLPDFYETNDESNYQGYHTMVDWDIMDYGSYNNNGNTPPSYSAYERWFMGWITPTLLNKAAHVSLPLLNESKSAALITSSGKDIADVLNPNPSTFYLLENRKKAGWDAYLPGKGLLITKITFDSDKWAYNKVNNSTPMGVDLMEAKSNSGQLGKATDAYPAGATSFTKESNYKLTNIALTNDLITFDVNGGGEEIIIEGIEDLNIESETPVKVLHEGNVYIIRNNHLYDLNGRIVR